MKANLPGREPAFLEKWERQNLYNKLRETAKGRKKFILHDGPPYANGDVHTGTAMNKILKDMVVRSHQMLGFDAPYVPGWDCHGLPIEWKVEEKYRAKGKSKDEVPPGEFRKECRGFADRWIKVQKEQFKRLGVLGDWDNPYTTMAFEAEATIVAEFLKFVKGGRVYRGAKPVMWSPVEKTALAEAEVEYHDHTSTQIWVKYPVIKAGKSLPDEASVVIWTTTPWTIPGSRAICYHPDLTYTAIAVEKAAEDSLAQAGDVLVVAKELLETFAEAAGIEKYKAVSGKGSIPGKDLAGTICAHPWRGKGYDFDVPLIPGDHVTLEQGTGLVHTAPGHGADDFEAATKAKVAVPRTVGPDGVFYKDVPLVGGEHVYKADPKVVELLKETGALLGACQLIHSYPHSWRSKAPLIFRNTEQWFISMSKGGLRDKALAAIEQVRWVPANSKNRIKAMVEGKPDWVISRQRAWGVPITLFTHRKTGKILVDEKVNKRILDAIRKSGADAWFLSNPEDFLKPEYAPEDYEQSRDILDVWFDSGSTHAFVVEARPELGGKADVYLEGSDQHRGWFQSSLIEAVATRGEAPYREVMTHGFVLDGEGRKMSKSLGNVVSPQKVVDQYGADIFRLWVASSGYFDDVRIGQQILQGQVDAYRKIRNTFRFLLGNLNEFEDAEKVGYNDLPELEKWVLDRLAALDELIRKNIHGYDFNAIYVALYNFCILDLSSFYFDIRKDSLYCDAQDSIKRRAARTVLDHLFNALSAWLAPLLVFTAEEVWQSRHGEGVGSVHLRTFPEIPKEWRNPELADKWKKVRALRRVVTGALEQDRRDRKIGSSLESAPKVYVSGIAYEKALSGLDLAEICITSGVEVTNAKPPKGAFALDEVPNVAVVTAPAGGAKCERCWKVKEDVGKNKKHPGLCSRCAEVVSALPLEAASS